MGLISSLFLKSSRRARRDDQRLREAMQMFRDSKAGSIKAARQSKTTAREEAAEKGAIQETVREVVRRVRGHEGEQEE